MKEAGFKYIRKSINNRQNTSAQYIATRTILDLCKGTNHIGGGEVVKEVVGSKGYQPGEREIQGGGEGLRLGDRHGRGRGTEHSQ